MSLLLDYKLKLEQINAGQEIIKPQLEIISQLQKDADEIKAKLRAEVEASGDQEGFGFKAYLQTRESVTYNPDKFIAKFPKMADLVTEVIVNKEKIAGLLKGKILKEEELEDCKEISITKAFYLKEVLE